MSNTVNELVDSTFSAYPSKSFSKGEILIMANENPSHIYYIKSGKVRMYDTSYRGDEIILTIFSNPAFFPMSWAINNTPNAYCYRAETDTTVHLIPIAEAVTFIQDHPAVQFDLLSRVYRGLDGVLGRVVHLMSGSAKSRLLYELLIESSRFGKEGNNGTVVVEVSESDLAARAGLSRETVSREMRVLKDSGLVQRDSRCVYITDIALLQKALGLTV